MPTIITPTIIIIVFKLIPFLQLNLKYSFSVDIISNLSDKEIISSFKENFLYILSFILQLIVWILSFLVSHSAFISFYVLLYSIKYKSKLSSEKEIWFSEFKVNSHLSILPISKVITSSSWINEQSGIFFSLMNQLFGYLLNLNFYWILSYIYYSLLQL